MTKPKSLGEVERMWWLLLRFFNVGTVLILLQVAYFSITKKIPRGALKEAEMYNANPLNLNRLRPAEERSGFMPTHSARRNFGEWEMKHFIFVAGLFSASMAFANTPVLTVYAPDYFASEWGPGPSIEAAFEKECNCDLQFKTCDVLSRIILECKHSNCL